MGLGIEAGDFCETIATGFDGKLATDNTDAALDRSAAEPADARSTGVSLITRETGALVFVVWPELVCPGKGEDADDSAVVTLSALDDEGCVGMRSSGVERFTTFGNAGGVIFGLSTARTGRTSPRSRSAGRISDELTLAATTSCDTADGC